MRAWLSNHSIVPAVAAVITVFWVVANHITSGTVADTWSLLGVVALDPSFADTRTITHSLEAIREGFDPYVERGFDPFGRVYNYPPGWLQLSRLGIDSGDTVAFATVMILALTLSLSAMFDCRSNATRFVAATAAASPPMLLLVERGNVDMIIFTLLALGIALSSVVSKPGRETAQVVLIIALTVLKIYPVAVTVVLVRGGRFFFTSVVAAALAVAVFYATLRPGDLSYILGTPQLVDLSYGAAPLLQALANVDSPLVDPNVRQASVVLAVLTAIAVVVIAYVRRRSEPRFVRSFRAGMPLEDIALACLAIYAFSFCLGANFDYRLIFLVGALPPMLRAFDETNDRLRLAFPGAVVTYLWLSRASATIASLDEVLGWLLFGATCYIVASNLFRRMSPEVHV